ARPPPARPGLGFPPRVWKRAIGRLLARREALLPRLVRRKPPWPHRRGRATPKPLRNSAKTATSAATRLRFAPRGFKQAAIAKPACATCADTVACARSASVGRMRCANRVHTRTLFFLRFSVRWRGLFGGLMRSARLDHLRLEEGLRRRCGRLGGLLAFLAGDADVLAAGEPLSLVCVARDADVDRHFDFGVQRNRHLMQSDRLDRRVKRDLSATDSKALFRDQQG